jgi:hypothetical protein
MNNPFSFDGAPSVSINVSNSSQSAQISGGNRQQIRVYNDGTATAWVNFGNSGVVASITTGLPIPSFGAEVFTVDAAGAAQLYAAAIAAASTGKVWFTPGGGI